MWLSGDQYPALNLTMTPAHHCILLNVACAIISHQVLGAVHREFSLLLVWFTGLSDRAIPSPVERRRCVSGSTTLPTAMCSAVVLAVCLLQWSIVCGIVWGDHPQSGLVSSMESSSCFWLLRSTGWWLYLYLSRWTLSSRVNVSSDRRLCCCCWTGALRLKAISMRQCWPDVRRSWSFCRHVVRRVNGRFKKMSVWNTVHAE